MYALFLRYKQLPQTNCLLVFSFCPLCNRNRRLIIVSYLNINYIKLVSSWNYFSDQRLLKSGSRTKNTQFPFDITLYIKMSVLVCLCERVCVWCILCV